MRDEDQRPLILTVSVAVQLVLGILFLPHELAHYIALLPWSDDAEIQLFVPRGEWNRSYIPPPARVTGSFDTNVPVQAIRFVCIAPTIIIGSIALMAGAFIDFSFYSVEFWVSWPLVSLWTAPSNQDFNSFYQAARIKEAGRFNERSESTGTKAVIASWTVSIAMSTLLFISYVV